MSALCGWHLQNGKRRRFLIALCLSLAPFLHSSEKDRDCLNLYQLSLRELKKESHGLVLWPPIKWLCVCTTEGKSRESRNWHEGDCHEGKVSHGFCLVHPGYFRLLKIASFWYTQAHWTEMRGDHRGISNYK